MGEQGPQGLAGTDGKDAERGPRGPRGERGEPGKKGDRGLQGRHGYDGGGGTRGPPGPPGADGGESVPQSATLTRDANGAVASVTVEGKAAWIITRDNDGSIVSLSDGDHNVDIDRDEAGVVTGTTVSEV